MKQRRHKCLRLYDIFPNSSHSLWVRGPQQRMIWFILFLDKNAWDLVIRPVVIKSSFSPNKIYTAAQNSSQEKFQRRIYSTLSGSLLQTYARFSLHASIWTNFLKEWFIQIDHFHNNKSKKHTKRHSASISVYFNFILKIVRVEQKWLSFCDFDFGIFSYSKIKKISMILCTKHLSRCSKKRLRSYKS